MNTYKQDTQLSIHLWTQSSVVACSKLAVLALALLCSTPSKAQCVVGTNSALSFDGVNDGASVPGNTIPRLDGFSDFTIEFWVKTAQPSQSFLLSKYANNLGFPLGSSWFIGTNNLGRIRSSLFSSSGIWSGTQVGVTIINDGLWHHVALTRSGTAVQLFIDGLLDQSYSFSGALSQVSTQFTIGISYLNSAAVSYLDGNLEEVRIWNIGKTQSQIQSTINRGLTLAEAANPNLVSYWRFDEGSGQTVFNSAAATGSALDGTLGANSLPGTDDPTWISTGLPPLPYCPPCPAPPCGQVNSPCATLTVNGVGAAAQGPFNVVVPAGSTLSFNWYGPPNQPCVLVATTNLVPGQVVAPPSFVVDVNIGNFGVLFSGFDPYWGPLYFTTSAGISAQTYLIPNVLSGSTLNLQGLIYDLANTCSGGVGLSTTASFSIQL